MNAYRQLGDSASLAGLQDAEKKQKSHRCVVDAADGLLKLKADMPMTEKEKKKAEALESRRAYAKLRAARLELQVSELQAEMKRRQRFKKQKTVAAQRAVESEERASAREAVDREEEEEVHDAFNVLQAAVDAENIAREEELEKKLEREIGILEEMVQGKCA